MANNEMVTVGCKLPNGLIMELVKPAEGRQLLPAPTGERVVLKGSNSLLTRTRSSLGPPAQGVHHYATNRVPKEFALEWFKRYKDLDCVKRGLVFLVEDAKDVKSVQAIIKERNDDSQTRTGLEALAPERDPRLKAADKKNSVTADQESMQEFERVA